MAGEAEAAEAAHGGAHSFPPFDASLFPHQLFWFVVSFVALYFLMANLVLPKIDAVLTARAGRIKGDLDAAAKAGEDAEAARLAADKSAADARAKARETIDAMRAAAQAEFAAEQAKVEKTIAERAAAAEARLRETRTAGMAEAPQIAAGLAKDIAARVTGGVAGAA
jgi:F-type H+-transporting ATPase subunit b